MSTKLKSVELGDCILSDSSLPPIDWILHNYEGVRSFDISSLNSYLSFLELLILHERLVCSPNYILNYNDILTPDDLESEDVNFCLSRLRLNVSSEVNLQEEVLESLQNKNILLKSTFKMDDLSPSKFIQRYSSTPIISEKLIKTQVFCKSLFEKSTDKAVLQRTSLAICSQEYGIPLFVSEFAGEAKLPCYLTNEEFGKLSEIMGIEQSIQRGANAYIKKRLDSGAKNEMARVEELGYETIFPRTPISAQILHESESPEDLLSVALSIRQEYQGFRQEMSKIERELFEPEISLHKKLKSIKYLEEMALELWPQSKMGFRQTTSEVSSLSNLAFKIGSSFAYQDVPATIKTISSAPWELIKKYLLRRKINVLLRSKKTFLNQRDNRAHIAKIFGCSEEMVKNSFHDYLMKGKK